MHQETCPRMSPTALLVERLNSRTDKQMEYIHTILYSKKMNELPLHKRAWINLKHETELKKADYILDDTIDTYFENRPKSNHYYTVQ